MGRAAEVMVGRAVAEAAVGKAASVEVWALVRRARVERMRVVVKSMVTVCWWVFVCGW